MDIRLRKGPDSLREEVLAFLSLFRFNGFREEENRILAYMESSLFDRKAFRKHLSASNLNEKIRSIAYTDIHGENWNKTWESQYDAVEIGRSCYVRAPFHPEKPGFTHSLVIVPKMSFGTAHHASTRLMMMQMMKRDLSGKEILDMGCGTGILAILAEKMGAAHILAADNYPLACENAMENLKLNHCRRVTVRLAEARELEKKSFDIILANITLNVLEDIIPELSGRLTPGGLLVTSGFYGYDFPYIMDKCTGRMEFIEKSSLDDWMVAVYRKPR